MSHRKVAFVFSPTQVDEARGVTIRRTIGGESLVPLYPFLLLDHVTLNLSQGGGVIGLPGHPHRGIDTLSYVLRGQVAHKNSLGNDGQVGPDGSQLMNAGNELFHEEMLIPFAQGGEFLQLWFNMPSAQKRISPAYVSAEPDTIPEMTDASGASVRVIAGYFDGKPGPFQGIAVRPTVLDVKLPARTVIELPAPAGEKAFAYVVEGEAICGDKSAKSPQLMVLTSGRGAIISAGSEGARFLFVSARPLDEPVVQYPSVVMNTVDDVKETLELIETGEFASSAH